MSAVQQAMWLKALLMLSGVIKHAPISPLTPLIASLNVTQTIQQRDSVQITEFMPAVISGHTGYYRLTFAYKFRPNQPLFIKGIGQIRSEGTLSFLTTTHTLTFTDQAGHVLKEVSLIRKGIPEGASAEMPEPSKFPQQSLSFTCSAQLDENQYGNILSQFFTEGYYPFIENNIKWYTTPYQVLSLPSASTKRAEISLRISAPVAIPGQQGLRNFQMQMLVRERGLKSATWATTVSDATMHEALAFQKRVVKRLQAGQ